MSATATLASAQFANQGTTTTLLHGNGAGNPSFSGVAYADILAAHRNAAAAGRADFTDDASLAEWAAPVLGAAVLCGRKNDSANPDALRGMSVEPPPRC